MTPARFADRMEKLGPRMSKALNTIGAMAAMEAGLVLVTETPIDTGRAKSNWQASLNSPKRTTRPAYAVGNQREDRPPVVDTTSENETRAFDQIEKVCRGRKQNRNIYLTNNLSSYPISRLDSSYDTIKSPYNRVAGRYSSNFVRRAVQAALTYIRDTNLMKRAVESRTASVGIPRS